MNYFRNFFQSLITKIENITYLLNRPRPGSCKSVFQLYSSIDFRLTNKIANYEKSTVD